MWLLILVFASGLGIGYWKGRNPSGPNPTVQFILTLLTPLIRQWIPQQTKPNTLSFSESQAKIVGTYMNRDYLLTFPLMQLNGRWAIAATCTLNNETSPLNLVVSHRLDITYIVGLPPTPAAIGVERVVVTMQPTPDDGSAPKIQTFTGSQPIRLEVPSEPLLEAYD